MLTWQRNAWKGENLRKTGENLNAHLTLSFRVDTRSVRERLTGTMAKHKQKYQYEMNAFGVCLEYTSLDETFEEISQKKWKKQINYITKHLYIWNQKEIKIFWVRNTCLLARESWKRSEAQMKRDIITMWRIRAEEKGKRKI